MNRLSGQGFDDTSVNPDAVAVEGDAMAEAAGDSLGPVLGAVDVGEADDAAPDAVGPVLAGG